MLIITSVHWARCGNEQHRGIPASMKFTLFFLSSIMKNFKHIK